MSVDRAHFFTEAPTVSWFKWFKRKLLGSREPMTLLPSTLPTGPSAIQETATGLKPHRMTAGRAAVYSKFLHDYYYSKQGDLRLKVPEAVLRQHLQEGDWIGAEVRDCDGVLAGLVLCQYAGLYSTTARMGLITWLCIHPTWRSKGLVNALLRAVYSFAHPMNIFWWRNDGWLQSPCPPVLSQTRMIRRVPRTMRLPIHTCKLHELGHLIVQNWSQQNKNGLVLYDHVYKTGLVEAYIFYKDANALIVCIVPTFETRHGQTFCEVVGWCTLGTTVQEYETRQYFETILDAVPYDWVDAPTEMPHVEFSWTLQGMTSWCCMGLDVGTAAQVPLLPLCAA